MKKGKHNKRASSPVLSDELNFEQYKTEGLERGLYVDALIYSMMVHHGQTRKFSKEPYVVHPIGVSEIILKRWKSHPELEFLRASALLHDALEDTWVKKEDLSRRFGNRLAEVVWEVSWDKTLPKGIREEKYLKKLISASDSSKIIKLADIEDNILDFTGGEWWRGFLNKSLIILNSLKIKDNSNKKQFEETREQLIKKIGILISKC